MNHKSELANLRDQQLAKLREQTGQPERITLDFACAAHDRDVRVTFARLSPAHVFRCESIEKSETRHATARARLQAIFSRSEPVRLRADEVDLDGVRCDGCAAKTGWTLCSRCKAFVCGARSGGGHFTCRDSCGATFRTTPLKAFDAGRGNDAGGQIAIGRTGRGLLSARKGR